MHRSSDCLHVQLCFSLASDAIHMKAGAFMPSCPSQKRVFDVVTPWLPVLVVLAGVSAEGWFSTTSCCWIFTLGLSGPSSFTLFFLGVHTVRKWFNK